MSMLATDITAPPAASSVAETPAKSHPAVAELVIRARKGWIAVDWAELWRHRELLFFLCWRDVKVRYKQAMLGFAWAVMAPLISVAIFSFIFGRGGRFNESLPNDLPYPLLAFSGLIPWLMVAQAIGAGGLSLVSQQNLLTKIYMPRLFIPASTIGSSLVDMAISWVVFAAMLVWFGQPLSWTVVFVPFLIMLTILVGLGLSFTLSALTVTYRDLRFLLPFMSQLGMLLSAVIYPASWLKANAPILYYLNPIGGLISAYRAAMFPGFHMDWKHFALSVAMIVTLFVVGLFYFRKTERRFADIT